MTEWQGVQLGGGGVRAEQLRARRAVAHARGRLAAGGAWLGRLVAAARHALPVELRPVPGDGVLLYEARLHLRLHLQLQRHLKLHLHGHLRLHLRLCALRMGHLRRENLRVRGLRLGVILALRRRLRRRLLLPGRLSLMRSLILPDSILNSLPPPRLLRLWLRQLRWRLLIGRLLVSVGAGGGREYGWSPGDSARSPGGGEGSPAGGSCPGRVHTFPGSVHAALLGGAGLAHASVKLARSRLILPAARPPATQCTEAGRRTEGEPTFSAARVQAGHLRALCVQANVGCVTVRAHFHGAVVAGGGQHAYG
mmetsp:Transcript_1093/g.2864  ORF Transcript_1093/g.2864 Transcript_1093/m.2864 type:complete len:309 (-) Transcript_1093:35-961(-)